MTHISTCKPAEPVSLLQQGGGGCGDQVLPHRTGRVRRRTWFRVALIGLLVAAGAVAISGYPVMRDPPPATQARNEGSAVLAVAVEPATIQRLTRSVVGTGSVVAWQELPIQAETGGLRVVEVLVEEGDQVGRGQVLIRFDETLLAAQLAQAEAAVAEAEAALGVARSDFNRAAELSRGAYIASQTVEQRQSAARQAEARLMFARARRGEANARLAQAQITSPVDGLVLRRSAQVGTVSAQGQELLRLARDGRLELDAMVPELELAAVRPGQVVRVTHGNAEAQATVRGVAPTVSVDTRLAVVHVSLPAGAGLRAGMFARADILVNAAPVLVVPQRAIVFREDTPAAFVLDRGDRVSLRRLTTGARQGEVVQVLAGLENGELVITSGAGFLSDGDQVQVRRLIVDAHRDGRESTRDPN